MTEEHGDKQSERCDRLFTAGKQKYFLHTLPRRLRSDINSRLAGAVGLREAHLSGAAPKERLERGCEMRVDDGKRFFKFLPGNLVQFTDRLLGIGNGLQQIGPFALEEADALFTLVVFCG